MTDGVPQRTAQLDAVVGLVRGVFAGDIVGLYLYGSAVQGGLRPRSDVDVLAVVARPTSAAERRDVVEGLFDISGRRARRGPDRPIELTIVVTGDVRPWRYPPRMELQYGEWLRDDFEAGLTPEPAANPDLAILLAMVRERGRVLVGPPPAEVVDPVPWSDVRKAMLDGIPGLLADLEGDEANVLLTLARIWSSIETGKIDPKDVAADWALARLPAADHAPLARARAVYLGEAADEWGDLRSGLPTSAGRLIARIKLAAATYEQGSS